MLARIVRNFKQSDFKPDDSVIASAINHPAEAVTRALRFVKSNMDTAAGVPDQYDNPYPWLAPTIEQRAEAANNLAGLVQTGAFASGAAPKSAGGTLGTLIKQGAPETEFSRAHAIAQQNAALPIEQGGLGLPANNTAMDRARAMGFDVDNPVYHGTGADFTEFNAGGNGKTHGAGAFFADNPHLSATYAPGVNGGNVIPALIRKDSPAAIEAGGANWSNLGPKVKLSAPKITIAANSADDELLAELTGLAVNSKPVTKKAVSGTLKKIFPREFRYGDERFSTDDLARWANEQGYGAAVFNGVKDRGPIGTFFNDAAAQPSQINAVFNPKNIRSRFAAFDPMKKDSANILASTLLGMGLAKEFANDDTR